MLRYSYMSVLLFLINLAHAQSIAVALAQQDGISHFTNYLQQNPDIINLLDSGIHTVLVPTDDAIVAAQYSMPAAFNTSDTVRALIEYHVLIDTHPSQSFSNSSLLVPTLLQNSSYTNVTGGQRLELLRKDGQPTFLSAIKAESRIVRPDVFFKGGLLHVVDAVLQIPLSFPDTITKANLPFLVALLNLGNWLAPDSIAYRLALETPDLTFIGPNDPKSGAGFRGWEGFTQAELDEIFLYHVMPRLVYTTDLVNNTRYPTLNNYSLTARRFAAGQDTQSANFLDQAHITTSNYITANGVLHIVDRPLDPKLSGSTPCHNDITSALGISHVITRRTISTAVIEGIAVGTFIILFVTGLILVILVRRSGRRRQGGNNCRIDGSISPPPNGVQSISHLGQHRFQSPLATIVTRFRAHLQDNQMPDNRSVQSFRTAEEPWELEVKEPYIQRYEIGATSQNLRQKEFGHVTHSRVEVLADKGLPKIPSETNTTPTGAAAPGFI